MRAFLPGVPLATLLGLLYASAPAAQPSSSVSLDVVVADATGHPALGLGAADFEITEDGRPVQVQTCSPVDAANDSSGARTYILVVDGFHLSPRGAERVQPLLEQFAADAVAAGDRVSVAWLGSSPRISRLTTDSQTLRQMIAAASSSARNIQLAKGSPVAGPLEFGARPDGAATTFALLTSAVNRVVQVDGRRAAVVFVSEGVAGADSESRRTADAERAFLTTAARHFVNVYPIDPLGMSSINSGLATPDESQPAGLAQWNSLRALAANTGGRATLGRTDLTSAYRQIAQDNSSYYLLSYASPHANERDGDFHEVRVRVKRAGAKVTTRKGWYEPK